MRDCKNVKTGLKVVLKTILPLISEKVAKSPKTTKLKTLKTLTSSKFATRSNLLRDLKSSVKSNSPTVKSPVDPFTGDSVVPSK